ncbi:carbohydrate esterase family 5 protein [Parathielavia hyrcaniae]|uniref:Carbohydrate esterase family 5 protein n=1 Tax=Parathielavia hyrcaniae TaxID=113614 RepID=A0AAN6SXQ6_9PEZI|nr:carbohydrate esterase family 5 protein [Parathielavia hyrcaniae]
MQIPAFAVPVLAGLASANLAQIETRQSCPQIHIFGARETTAPAGYGTLQGLVNMVNVRRAVAMWKCQLRQFGDTRHPGRGAGCHHLQPALPYNVGTCQAQIFAARPRGFQRSPASSSIIQSYCESTDPYCCTGNDANSHQQYVNKYGQQALRFIKEKLGAA